MTKRLILACLLLWAAALHLDAQESRCDVCGQVIKGKFYFIEDHACGGKKRLCEDCGKLDTRCFACGVPVKQDFKTLADGRLLCARDAKDAIDSDETAAAVCADVKEDLNRLFSRFMTFPGDNVVVTLVDKFHLESLFRSPGYEKSCISVYGATQSQPLPGKKMVHSVSVLSHLKKSRLMAVCAHEYAHTWLNENLKADRKSALAPETVEGFCELIAWKYMESRKETFEMQVIESSDYTKGQIAVLTAVDQRFGFNALLDWMQQGEDTKLETAGLDHVRFLKGEPVALARSPAYTAALLYVPPTVPTPVPDKLTLKGISGTPNRRLAIINNETFAIAERHRVRVGQTNVVVRCLAIRDHSVLIQQEGVAQPQELLLGAR